MRARGGNDPFGSAAIKVSFCWMAVAAIMVGLPFCFVWKLASWDSAFQIVTGSLSPFQPGLGPAGSILAFVGYLLAPAAVGAIAALWFTRNIQRTYGGKRLAAAKAQLLADVGAGGGTAEQRAAAAAEQLRAAADGAAKTMAASLNQAQAVANDLNTRGGGAGGGAANAGTANKPKL